MTSLGDRICEHVKARLSEWNVVGVEVTCKHLSDPNEYNMEGFRPEQPWVPFIVRLKYGNQKTVEIGFDVAHWDRHADNFEGLRDQMEGSNWKDLVARASNGERIVFGDDGWRFER